MQVDASICGITITGVRSMQDPTIFIQSFDRCILIVLSDTNIPMLFKYFCSTAHHKDVRSYEGTFLVQHCQESTIYSSTLLQQILSTNTKQSLLHCMKHGLEKWKWGYGQCSSITEVWTVCNHHHLHLKHVRSWAVFPTVYSSRESFLSL